MKARGASLGYGTQVLYDPVVPSPWSQARLKYSALIPFQSIKDKCTIKVWVLKIGTLG